MIERLLAATSAENIGMLINNANARRDVLRVLQWLLNTCETERWFRFFYNVTVAIKQQSDTRNKHTTKAKFRRN